jgi:hypothetical protein
MKNYFFKLDDFILDPEFEVLIAEKEEDLEAAFKLFHDCYVNQGRIKAQRSGIYCQLYHFLPGTSTVIVKYRNVVIGAVTLVKDSVIGLPIDQYYPAELAKLRSSRAALVEASSIAVTRHFRTRDAIATHLLIKYVYQFCARFLGASHVIFTTHPERTGFYTDFWKLKKLGRSLQYQSTEESQIQGLVLDLSNDQLLKLSMSFSTNESLRNLGSFLTDADERFKYPSRRVGQIVDLVMTPELLEHFFLDRSNIYEELDMRSRKLFLEIYVQLYGAERMTRFLNLDVNFKLRELRLPVMTSTGIRIGDQRGIGKILDISSKGCFIQAPSQFEDHIRTQNGEVTLSFRLGDKAFEAQGQILWKNQGRQVRYPNGFGVKFKTPLTEIKSEFISWMKGFDPNKTSLVKA